jgi:sirohydrochlorin ferrochelatase
MPTEARTSSTDTASRVGVILVDHGSRVEDANLLLERVAARFKEQTRLPIVEPAHMELAPPDIAAAFDRCVAQGATHVIVTLFFLSPGRHSLQDIPRMTAEAASCHPGVTYSIGRPLGDDDVLHAVFLRRIADAAPADWNPPVISPPTVKETNTPFQDG